MKIAGIDFPDELITALDDRKLVVFAGAGVSMGAPANLPDFKGLANAIAEGTGEERWSEEKETDDQFLGRLRRERGVKVHDRAARELKKNNPAPTNLHHDLLRLYPDSSSVRIVTTNFDELFEDAAKDDAVFKTSLKVFTSPALPLGRDFKGMVHVHGSIDDPQSMVITDKDFGRAYFLDGYARRFLVSLFQNWNVLFVGYSHNDTIMNYLARALSPSTSLKRFALTPEDKVEHWTSLGIEPIGYRNITGNHAILYEAVEELAKFTKRDTLGGKRAITEIAMNPPLVLNDKDIVEHALRDEIKTRFFTETADSEAWIGWLDERQFLDALFKNHQLSPIDRLLYVWLANKFAIEYSDELLRLIGKHGMRLHPDFWRQLTGSISQSQNASLNADILQRWIPVLLETVPSSRMMSEDSVIWLPDLAKKCTEFGLHHNLMQIYDVMIDKLQYSELQATLVSSYRGPSSYSHQMKKVWCHYLKPLLDEICESLLERTILHLNNRHASMTAWQTRSIIYLESSLDRSAIETHSQNDGKDAWGVVIDIARDCLEHLANQQSDLASHWCEKLIRSDLPILKRLAVHTLSVRDDMTADEKIDWLLNRCDIHESTLHHEVFRIMRQTYGDASDEIRDRVLESVSSYQFHSEGVDDESITDRHRFDWLHMLSKANPNCVQTKIAYDKARSGHAEWLPREHPDFHAWTGEASWIPDESPWGVDELLSKPPLEWIDALLSFREGPIKPVPNRAGLVNTVGEASKHEFEWGMGLSDALSMRGEWSSDLWRGLIQGWAEADLDEKQYRKVFNMLLKPELQSARVHDITDALLKIVEDEGKSNVVSILSELNQLAISLWGNLDQYKSGVSGRDMLTGAINHPAGKVAQYWLSASSVWRKSQDVKPDALDDVYRTNMLIIIRTHGISGKYGKAVFASALPYLLYVDENWTKEHLLPLFNLKNPDFASVWDGFMYARPLNPQTAKAMSEKFLQAVQEIDGKLSGIRDRFASLYSSMILYYVDDPLERWIPELFNHANIDDKRSFVIEIEHYLQKADSNLQSDCWNGWLKKYWLRRLDNIPNRLEPVEVEEMLRWVPLLTELFDEAVDIATEMDVGELEHALIRDIVPEWAIEKHPESSACFIIYLDKFETGYWVWHDAGKVVNRLITADIPGDLKHRLEELKTRRVMS